MKPKKRRWWICPKDQVILPDTIKTRGILGCPLEKVEAVGSPQISLTKSTESMAKAMEPCKHWWNR